MKTWQQVLTGFFLGMISAGLLFLIVQSPGGEPLQLAPNPTPKPIVIHITGAVVDPGVYSLPSGSRIVDLVELAGGFTEQANPDSVNLAGILQDGIKIYIPKDGEIAANTTQIDEINTEPVNAIVNINTATTEELESLPGIGASKAAQIIEFRSTYGKFKMIEDIMDVPGIGPSLFEDIQNLITVN